MKKEDALDLIAVSRRYFSNDRDDESFVWVFCPDELPDFVCSLAAPSLLRSSACFGDEDFSIHIIQQFASPRPILLNFEAMRREISLQFRPTAIMDSNLVSYVHQYVTAHPTLDARRRKTLYDFLCFVVSNQIDYNPFFYYLEGAIKDEHATLHVYAREVSESILRLHTMDKECFLTSADIVTNPVSLATYAAEYGVETIEEIAPLHARSMVRSAPYLETLARPIYATLLKIGLIQKSGIRAVADRYRELVLFMRRTLGFNLGPERILALGYFAGQYDGFIPVQRGANPDRLFKRLRAATWDMLLLRLPADLLSRRIENQVVVGYISTSDRALQQIAAASKLDALMVLSPSTRPPLSLVSFDVSTLEPLLGPRTVAEIKELDADWKGSGSSPLADAAWRISRDDLFQLIAELEAETLRFCSG